MRSRFRPKRKTVAGSRLSDRLKDSPWKRKRVLAFACHIQYGLPTMKQQFGCPHIFH
jgi:hypothetical protein